MRDRTTFTNLISPQSLNRECSIRRLGWCVVFSLGLLAMPACRQAAFNEYYVESMAAEIRGLEDRIYEYDSAYQSLELENEDLRSKYERLQRKLRELEAEEEVILGGKPKSSAPREPRNERGSVGSANDSDSFELVPTPKSKTDEPAPIVPRSPTPAPSTNTPSNVAPPAAAPGLPGSQPSAMPPAIQDSTESVLPKVDDGSVLPPPATNGLPATNGSSSNSNRTRKPTDVRATELVEEYTVPPALIRSAQQPGAPNLLTPPAVEHLKSNGVPSAVPKPLTLPGTSPGAIIQGRIRTPMAGAVVQASAIGAKTSATDSSIGIEPVNDRRVVGIEFHSTLCRGINLDQVPGDDGIYIVLTPRNRAGQIVNDIGHITIVAEETTEDQSKRISSWMIDPIEMAEYLEPIGASQGFHLRLPWQGTGPSGRTIQVFVKCEFEDGRKLVNRREITLSRSAIRPLTWTPRK